MKSKSIEFILDLIHVTILKCSSNSNILQIFSGDILALNNWILDIIFEIVV